MFRPLDLESRADCLVCSSSAHASPQCPSLRPCLLQIDSVVSPRLVATLRELSEPFEAEDISVCEEMENESSANVGNFFQPAPRLPTASEDDQIKVKTERREDENAASAESRNVDSLQRTQKSVTLNDHYNDAFIVQEPVIETRNAETALMVTLLAGPDVLKDGVLQLEIGKRQEGQKMGLQKVATISGRRMAKFRNSDFLQRSLGREIKVKNSRFRLDPYLPWRDNVFLCCGIPLGENGVSKVAALQSIVQLTPGQERLRVLLRARGSRSSDSWIGDFIVVLETGQPIDMFSFKLPIDGHEVGDPRNMTLEFKPDAGDGKVCIVCPNADHGTKDCPQFVTLLLDDGHGTYARLCERFT